MWNGFLGGVYLTVHKGVRALSQLMLCIDFLFLRVNKCS